VDCDQDATAGPNNSIELSENLAQMRPPNVDDRIERNETAERL
jgi:hypothetical protein